VSALEGGGALSLSCHRILFRGPATSEGTGEDAASDDVEEATEVTPKAVLAVLKRRPLSPNARKMLEIVWKAGPPGLTMAEIGEKMGVSDRVLFGVHSAFVRRIYGTPGWPQEKYFFAWDSDAEERGEELRYWMGDVVSEVLNSGKFQL
jgi:hypothetical protein